ncbi:hypothetical protein Tco_1080577 [Tanacetum coccineum]|uniref:Uncharacterized protein n=1 Tax=Tanacetum coccineum TaxID=301880 RepID=A0ABQ5HX24_9ASTR
MMLKKTNHDIEVAHTGVYDPLHLVFLIPEVTSDPLLIIGVIHTIVASRSPQVEDLKYCTKTHLTSSRFLKVPRGNFINQSKYALESLKKYRLESCDPVGYSHGGRSPYWYEDFNEWEVVIITLSFVMLAPPLSYSQSCYRHQISASSKELLKMVFYAGDSEKLADDVTIVGDSNPSSYLQGQDFKKKLDFNGNFLGHGLLYDHARDLSLEISIADQIALDDALVAPANRLKIEIYMQEFWASAYIHNRSVRFKMNNKKHTLNLDQLRDILQICPKVGNKKFEEPPLEKEILAFLASLGHSGEIRKITDVNVNKLHQPWRSFAAIINKCLSGKPSYDSLRLSQAQILWGMYNNKKVDYAYLLWEDFIYQIENKNTKKGNAMYYPRFTKLVVNCVMDKDPSIPRRNKLYGTILPVALTNEDIRNSESYKEYYAIASGKIPPKTKGSKKKADTDTTTKQKPPTIPKEKKEKKSGKGKQKAKELKTIFEAVLTEAEQLKIITKRSRKETHNSHTSGSGADEGTGISPGVPDAPDYDSNDVISWKRRKSQDEDATDEVGPKKWKQAKILMPILKEEMIVMTVCIYLPQGSKEIEDTHVTLTPVNPDGQQQSSSVSSGFVSNMLNPNQDTGVDDIFEQHAEATSLIDTPVTAIVEPSFSAPTNHPPTPNPLVIQIQQPPILTPATTTSSSLQNLPNFASLFGFDYRLKALEDNFSELRQTNQYAKALSSIPGIVDHYLANKMQEAVDVAVQLKYDRIREVSNTENQQFLDSIDEGMKKVIKEQVKKEVSKITPKIEKLVIEQLESEVLVRSSKEANTSHAVAANLSELELKKILIDKMEANNSINRSIHSWLLLQGISLSL